ncbi:hypothetical protein QYE76_001553 [Lolium multiflorum]|uniref:Transposon protein, putative, CACTA, En/Spm sub-class n=1 Tax=Lolium multiflorum TaxID=4521 RepID=A0AAD8RK19_LOLMU|nr:hypothetical protein QYE76_001553 [Lolium multiflorum]
MHLLRHGFMPSYNCWTKHGERGVIMEEDEEGDDFIDESYLAHFGDTFMEDAEGEGEGEGEGEEEARDEPVDDLGRTIADARRRCETEKERENLDRMLEDHRKALYPGCDDGLKKLGCTLDLLKWKAHAGVADSAFENLLTMLKNMFPKNNELPAAYEAKKVVCPLGLEVLKIHACIDCILYRGEYENLNECPVCTALRYKIRGDDPGDDVEGQKTRKKVPAKVMWYAPIIPRLKRLFRNKEHAKLLRWHKEDRKSDGELRHPADGTQWRKIDREFKDFAAARNIRFGLSTDGMNPFGEQSSSHSTWPVTLCIYNLPPWLCMKRKFIMMPVLIQGRASYALTKEEKVIFFECLSSMKVPSGFSSNIKGIINMAEKKFQNLKSHDCHVIMTQLLPVALRGLLPENVRVAIVKLCAFLNAISQSFELVFPPSFFNIMTHLLVHLVEEISILGPVFLHNMFPFERFMGILKKYVRNRARPEGSIAKGYGNEEVVDQLYMLAKTPSSTITTFQGYEINGNTFYTIAQDKKSTNQNSGVRFDAATENGQKVTYYGYIEEIWELDYGPSFKVPLFRCKWFKLTGGGVKVDQQYGMTMVDFNNLGYLDEPFVLAKDVAQVFYVKDMSSKPRKRKDKKTISTSCDDPKRHIVLSGKRNIVGVEDKTDMSEDYNMFGEIPPFKVNTDPSIKLNDEDAPWIRPINTSSPPSRRRLRLAVAADAVTAALSPSPQTYAVAAALSSRHHLPTDIWRTIELTRLWTTMIRTEDHMFGIINGDILYVPTGQEEDDISSYLNLDGEDEGRRRQDDAEETSINDDLQLEVATTSGAEPSAGSSKQSSTSSKRGATKTLKQGEIYTIEVVDSATGKPLEPEKNATKFINQCGAVVRDNVSITVQEWNEPKKARLGFTFVDKRTKKDCLQKLLEHRPTSGIPQIR